MHTQRAFGSTLAAGFGVCAVVVLFVGMVGYSSVSRLIESDRQVSRTHQVRRDLSELQARLTDAETGQRGYVITGDERFLAPYITGLEQIRVLTGQLREVMADTPDQIGVLDRVDRHIEAKLAELKETVEMRRTDGFDPAAKVVSGGAGKKIMDEIRVLIADLDRHEQTLLLAQTENAESARARAKVEVLAGTGIGLLVVVGTGWYLARSLARRLGATRSSDELRATTATPPGSS